MYRRTRRLFYPVFCEHKVILPGATRSKVPTEGVLTECSYTVLEPSSAIGNEIRASCMESNTPLSAPQLYNVIQNNSDNELIILGEGTYVLKMRGLTTMR